LYRYVAAAGNLKKLTELAHTSSGGRADEESANAAVWLCTLESS
jgi:hypothetical protein